jgi:CspA family cold shock protein
MQTGTIKTLTDRGFGFIVIDGASEGGKDLFFHSNELKNVKFEELREGDKVTFEVAEGQKGPNAVNVNKV